MTRLMRQADKQAVRQASMATTTCHTQEDVALWPAVLLLATIPPVTWSSAVASFLRPPVVLPARYFPVEGLIATRP
ncbi:hypothetical protein E2C01_059706 [Portunus trituberculatus]|uniref:Uncharacterized protein n=1 Tax=Portunus trituberculatus TaxID=210409 RepID=A0A5B7H957_PORTR|nr:hypothetical protein [Portunus trituberculatus]